MATGSALDPRLDMVTITAATVTPDLREATVYYTVYGDDDVVAVSIGAENRHDGLREASLVSTAYIAESAAGSLAVVGPTRMDYPGTMAAEYYDYIVTYSPYDNLQAKAYPAMFVGTGLWDSQVQYWEPAKYVARLRDLNTGTLPVVFRTNMEAGHGGKSGRFQRYRETAEYYAFVLDQLGVVEQGAG